jgi:hypothetical protein
MQTNPSDIIGEILGEPAMFLQNPKNLSYVCPFINSQCTKRSQKLSGPYPICSIFHGRDNNRKLMCICPKRFYQADF